MNQVIMASSLSNSLYNAIIPYQEGDYTELPYQTSEYYRMEGYHTHGLQEADFMNTESSQPLDADLLRAFSDSDFTPLSPLTDVDMAFISHQDIMSGQQILHDHGSEGADDSVSDYSEPDSSYEGYDPAISIMNDNVYPDYNDSSGYQTDPELMSCQPMSQLVFTPENLSHDNPSQKKKPGRKKGQTSKVLHLWEFIRDLLKDPQCEGDIIQWENKAEGVFRVIKSSEVASLWGQKKKNKKEMTYEKMSRSMRYSRKEGYFIDLPKNSGYPKKLCFRFGPKSTGWQ